MPYSVGDNGLPRNIILASIGVGNAPKTITNGYIGVNGVPKSFYTSASAPPAFSVSVSPLIQSTPIFDAGFGGDSTGGALVAVAVTGGSGNETFAWRKITGSVRVSASPMDADTTTILYSHSASIPETTTWVCDVTDGGQTLTTQVITVNFT